MTQPLPALVHNPLVGEACREPAGAGGGGGGMIPRFYILKGFNYFLRLKRCRKSQIRSFWTDRKYRLNSAATLKTAHHSYYHFSIVSPPKRCPAQSSITLRINARPAANTKKRAKTSSGSRTLFTFHSISGSRVRVYASAWYDTQDTPVCR